MGISRRQDGARRGSGERADPRASRGAGHRGQGGVPRAVHLRVARIHRFPSPDAALSVPALGGDTAAARAPSAQMGQPEGHGFLSDAAGRLAALADAARSALSKAVLDSKGTTAIEYAVIASMISIVIVTAA